MSWSGHSARNMPSSTEQLITEGKQTVEETPVLIWKDPPPAKEAGRTRVWDPLLRALRERPGEWALLRTAGTKYSAKGMVGNLRQRRVTLTVDVAEYEFRYDGADIYGRYVGSGT